VGGGWEGGKEEKPFAKYSDYRKRRWKIAILSKIIAHLRI
jgi:hypothetical protein